MKIAVIGAGSWGTALTIILGRNGHEVILAGRSEIDIATLSTLKENIHYLPGFAIPENVTPVTLNNLSGDADCYIIAVPSQSVPQILPCIPNRQVSVVLASKGFIEDTPYLLSQFLQERLPLAHIGVLSGPNLAVEIARGIPSASVVASNDIEIAEKIAQVFRSSVFRIYTSQDILGVELAGALKNVLAIAGGISDGLGFGQNTKGVLVARGLHEITRLGIAMGARIDTFMGVAGVGDLFTTAQSDLSRNYRVGVALGKGQKLEEILKELGQVAEGVPTSKIALRIARAYNVCLPITEMTAAILAGQVKPHKAVTLLMERKAKQEGYVETDYSWEKPLHA